MGSVMNNGLAQIAKSFGYNLSGAVARYLAVGIGVTNADGVDTLVDLDSEVIDSGLARAEATVTSQTTTETDDTVQLYKSWSATGSKTLSEVGVFSGSVADDSTMLARERFASTYAVQDGYTVQMTFKIILA